MLNEIECVGILFLLERELHRHIQFTYHTRLHGLLLTDDGQHEMRSRLPSTRPCDILPASLASIKQHILPENFHRMLSMQIGLATIALYRMALRTT